MLSWTSRRGAPQRPDPLSLSLIAATTNTDIVLRPVDLSHVEKLKDKIRPFQDRDVWLKELYSKFDDYSGLVRVYNANYKPAQVGADDEASAFARAADLNFQNAFRDSLVQGSLHISVSCLAVIEEHTEVIIASRILDPRWQVANYGLAVGLLNFSKNIFTQYSLYALAGGCVGVPAGILSAALGGSRSGGAQSGWSLRSAALTVGGLGAVVATAWQVFATVITSRKESEVQLSLWVEQMQTRNSALHARFRDCHVDNRFDKMDHFIGAVDESSTRRDRETQEMISYGNHVLNSKIDENTNTVRNIYSSFHELQSAMEMRVSDLHAELGAITQSQKELHSRFYSFQSFGRNNFASMQSKQKLIARSLRLLDSRNGSFQNKIHESIAAGVASVARLEEGQSKIQITIEDTNSKLTFITTLVQENYSSSNLIQQTSLPLLQSGKSRISSGVIRHNSAPGPLQIMRQSASPLLEEIE